MLCISIPAPARTSTGDNNTDLVAVLEGSEKIKVEKIGPIAFKKNWKRFPETVEFSENNDRVCYDFGIDYQFDATKSQKGLTPDSVLQVGYHMIIWGIIWDGDCSIAHPSLDPFLIAIPTALHALRVRC